MEKEEKDRILDYIVEYFRGIEGEGIKKEESLHIFKGKKDSKTKGEKRNEEK